MEFDWQVANQQNRIVVTYFQNLKLLLITFIKQNTYNCFKPKNIKSNSPIRSHLKCSITPMMHRSSCYLVPSNSILFCTITLTAAVATITIKPIICSNWHHSLLYSLSFDSFSTVPSTGCIINANCFFSHSQLFQFPKLVTFHN